MSEAKDEELDNTTSDNRHQGDNQESIGRRISRLEFALCDTVSRRESKRARREQLSAKLEVAEKVSKALETLHTELFANLLETVEEKITLALQEILEQPIQFRADAKFQRNSASVEFWIEREGKKEDLLLGQGGSVANIVSVCLRMFALTTLDERKHRRFLVLDEQDCWLRSDLVPKLVKIIHDASQALGFQVLMISHHDRQLFEQYADKVIELQWSQGKIRCVDVTGTPFCSDP